MDVMDAGDRIQSFVIEHELVGFCGLALAGRGTASSLDLYWKGRLPGEMDELLAELRTDVRIDVHGAPYSLDELMQEIERLIHLDVAETGARITVAGPLDDYTGLRIGFGSEEELDRARSVMRSEIPLTFVVQGPARLV